MAVEPTLFPFPCALATPSGYPLLTAFERRRIYALHLHRTFATRRAHCLQDSWRRSKLMRYGTPFNFEPLFQAGKKCTHLAQHLSFV